MTSKELSSAMTTPLSVEFTDKEVIVRFPRAKGCTSETGKMQVHATTNGWVKTALLDPSGQPLQFNCFVGYRL